MTFNNNNQEGGAVLLLPGPVEEVDDTEFVLSDYIDLDYLDQLKQEGPECFARTLGYVRSRNGQWFLDDPRKAGQEFVRLFFAIHTIEDQKIAIWNSHGFYIFVRWGGRQTVGKVLIGRILLRVLDSFGESLKLHKLSDESIIIQYVCRVLDREGVTFDDQLILPLINGALDLATNILIPFSPKHMNTYQLQIQYDPAAQCPRFLQFMKEITLENDTMQALLQEEVGYLISQDCSAGIAPIWISSGASGKSVLADIVSEMIGSGNVSSLSISQLNEKFATGTLDGKRVNISNENDVTAGFNSAIFRSLVTNDLVNVEHKHEGAYAKRLGIKFLFLLNRFPETLIEDTVAFWRRIIITPFPAQFLGEKADLYLIDKLRQELPGILNWALVGYRRLVENGYRFTEYAEGQDFVQELRNEINPFVQFFEQTYLPDPHSEIIKSSVYEAYQTWSKKNRKPDSNKREFWGFLDPYIKQTYPQVRFIQRDLRILVGLKKRSPQDLLNLPIEPE